MTASLSGARRNVHQRADTIHSNRCIKHGVLSTVGMSACDTHVTESGTLAFRVALSMLRHREDAEDVAQEAVVRALERFSSLRDRTRFRAWLVRLTWRLALDRRRADGRRAVRETRLATADRAEAAAEHRLMARERAAHLWAAIDDLPPRLRQPLVL